MSVLEGRPVQVLVAAACVGVALSNVGRPGTSILAAAAAAVAFAASAPRHAAIASAIAAAATGWWWGGLRLDQLDRSVLAPRIGTAERVRAVITSPPRRGRFDVRMEGEVVRFGRASVHERTLIRMPPARPPPQGAVVDGIGRLAAPKPPRNGFDEQTWLRRHAIHTVLHLDTHVVVGHRRGIGGISDRIRGGVRGAVARGQHGERAALLTGIVLGDDADVPDGLRRRFRASGLYHLLAVSGQNVALVGGGALLLAWLVGLSRRVGEIGALAAIAAYVLAVGAQPSVVRAGIAGALTSLAWLTGRLTDRWHFLLVGALVLLAWNPYSVFDAGFQLSFAAVAAIFALVPRLRRVLEGYPVPSFAAEGLAVSAACAAATAPVMWMQFHAVSLVAIPANAVAAPAMAPLLAVAFTGAAVAPFAPSAATALAWLNGWLAAYVAACARVAGGLPGAQVQSTRSLLLLVAGAFIVAAYACGRREERYVGASRPG
ncbi:MAG: ComEC/Rec2 family competence protein [Gaiellaceae bacterium]